MHRKKKKKKFSPKRIWNKHILNLTNIFMVLCSIAASYFAVFLSNSFAESIHKKSQNNNIEESTYRIAEAFEEYNLKRFNY